MAAIDILSDTIDDGQSDLVLLQIRGGNTQQHCPLRIEDSGQAEQAIVRMIKY